MFKLIKLGIGLLVGIIAIILFIYFGGGEYLKKFGAETEKAGKEVIEYEKDMKKTVKKVKDTVEDKKKKARKYIP
ncbi:MAG: hypothetical protein V3T30_09025 [Thermodesulfobacteriota bacterium]